MEQIIPPLGSEATPDAPASSLAGRLFNIFVAPGEVFDEIKSRPVSTVNWLVPMILLILTGWIATTIINSQEFAEQQMTAMQEKGLQAQVQSGKMTQPQADQALHMILVVVKVMSYIGTPFATAGVLFLSGLVFWLLGSKALKGQFPYMKGVEAMGLISMTGILAQVVRVSLVLVKGNLMASPSLALLLKEPNPMDPLFSVLSALNVFSFWWLGLICLGLVKLAGASVGRAAVWVFGIWATFTAVMLGIATVLVRLAPH